MNGSTGRSTTFSLAQSKRGVSCTEHFWSVNAACRGWKRPARPDRREAYSIIEHTFGARLRTR